MLEVSGLACTRGERDLFCDVSFKLESHGLLQVAGANGSGKTGLLRMVCGLGVPDAGEIRWRGEPIRTLREVYWRELVYIGHTNALKDDLSATENLHVACRFAGRQVSPVEIREALAQFGLESCAQLPARVLSQGQKRRSALTRLALSHEVPLWILDEPFSALDAVAVAHLETLIGSHVDGGGCVIFTTHQDASIAARVSQRVDLDAGRTAAC